MLFTKTLFAQVLLSIIAITSAVPVPNPDASTRSLVERARFYFYARPLRPGEEWKRSSSDVEKRAEAAALDARARFRQYERPPAPDDWKRSSDDKEKRAKAAAISPRKNDLYDAWKNDEVVYEVQIDYRSVPSKLKRRANLLYEAWKNNDVEYNVEFDKRSKVPEPKPKELKPRIRLHQYWTPGWRRSK